MRSNVENSQPDLSTGWDGNVAALAEDWSTADGSAAIFDVQVGTRSEAIEGGPSNGMGNSEGTGQHDFVE